MIHFGCQPLVLSLLHFSCSGAAVSGLGLFLLPGGLPLPLGIVGTCGGRIGCGTGSG